jgi:hypothetical protein
MRAHQFLTEGTLTPGELFRRQYLDWRPQNFLKKLETGTPFVDKQGNQYYPADGEFKRLGPQVSQTLNALQDNPMAKLPSLVLNYKSMISKDGEEQKGGSIAVSNLEKADLQTIRGQVSGAINVQPLGIGIAADPINPPGTRPKDKIVLTTDEEIKRALDKHQEIKAGDLYKVIMSNTVLDEAGDLGKAVKEAATEINDKKIPNIKQYDVKIQNRVAIDAGEYLGVLAMAKDVANFPKRDAFLRFLKAPNFDSLSVIFPGSQNASLGDSYGVQNAQTGHNIIISSKGGMGSTAVGAAPSLGGLRTSVEKRKSKIKPGNGLDFINHVIAVKPTTAQGFAAINWVAKNYPDALPDRYRKIAVNGVPFYSEDVRKVLNNINTNGAEPIPKKYLPFINTPGMIKSKAVDGGKFTYVITKELVDIINSGIIPGFRETILELLDENFVQIFSRVVRGNLTTTVLWPGKVDGNVELASKMNPGDPGKAGLGFKVTD